MAWRCNADAMRDVLLMVVTGNLRHRIEKLGIEKPESRLTEGQHCLRVEFGGYVLLVCLVLRRAAKLNHSILYYFEAFDGV